MMAMSDGRAGCIEDSGRSADPRQVALQELRAADTKIAVKFGDGRRLVSQCGDLPQHIEAVGLLIFVADGDERGRRPLAAVDPLGGDSEPAHVQALQGLADFLGRTSLGHQPFSFLLEPGDERRAAHPHLVSGPRFEQHGFLAAEDLVLETAARSPRS